MPDSGVNRKHVIPRVATICLLAVPWRPAWEVKPVASLILWQHPSSTLTLTKAFSFPHLSL